MIISAQRLALYIEQDYVKWDALKRDRAKEHILTAGAEVRGALAALYNIPAYTRDSSGNITSPAGVLDPADTALGPIVMMLAAAYLIDPVRGFQPQEERSAAADYRISARAQLKALQNGTTFIAALDRLGDYGITATDRAKAMFSSLKQKSAARIVQPNSGYFGNYHNPASGKEFEK
jgi:hypothetical protein